MTKNPTIDGVSRVTIHHLKINRKPFDDLVSGRKTSEVRNCADREFREGDHVELFLIDETGNPANKSIVRTITHIQRGYGLPDDICVLSYAGIDAPAAERQEPASPLSDIGQAQLLAICRGSAQRCEEQHAYMASAISDPYNWFPHKWVLDAMSSLLQINANNLQSIIAQLEDKLNKAIDLDFQRRETIEQLQARVQELESGRGEPVCYQARHSENEPWFFTDKPGYWEWRPLFTAPPAPVAVVLPELYSAAKEYLDLRDKIRKEGTTPHSDYWHQSLHETEANLRACIDATAALNTIHVGELDPAERLALARGEPK